VCVFFLFLNSSILCVCSWVGMGGGGYFSSIAYLEAFIIQSVLVLWKVKVTNRNFGGGKLIKRSGFHGYYRLFWPGLGLGLKFRSNRIPK